MSDPIDEQALDEYLNRGSAVSQRYRELDAADVPAELDRRVLDQARVAVAQESRPSRRWLRWSAPAALAASVVLVLSIVVRSGVEQTTLEPPSHVSSEILMAPQAAPPQQEDAAAAAAESRAGQESARAAESKTVSPQFVPEIAADPAPVERAVAPDTRATSETTSASAARMPRARAESAHIAAEPVRDPERWLEEIRALRKNGRNELADDEWTRFREAFPDHPVAEGDLARGQSTQQPQRQQKQERR